MTIQPKDHTLTVQRHAPYPSLDSFQLIELLTRVPYDLTGATLVFEVRLRDGEPGDPLLTETLNLPAPLLGRYGPPTFSEADHEGLPPSNPHDGQPLTGAVRLRYGIKATGVSGLPSPAIIQRGYYIVEEGANG